MIGFTKSVARELACRGITVNAIAPGFIETAMTAKISPEAREALLKQIPLGSLGQPEDVARRRPVPGQPGGPLHHRPGAARGRRHGDVTFFDSGLDAFRIVA